MHRNPDHFKFSKITPDGLTPEITHRQYDEDTADIIYSGCALMLPEHWGHDRYKLTMTMLDLFTPNDDFNIVPTVLFRRLRSSHCTPCNAIICGTV